LQGRFPEILRDPIVGEAASSLYADATEMLDRIITEGWAQPRAVIGIWPANRDGDDIALYTDEARDHVRVSIPTLRQQRGHSNAERPNLALADFIAPADSDLSDHLGGFVVTVGPELEARATEFERAGDDYNAILVKALADRLAEAFAERMHERVRREFWGYAPNETLDNTALIAEQYRGIRPAPGYPACPDHTGKRALFELLDAEAEVGVELTENLAMWPPASVSGYYFAHPDARYFGVGRIGADQVADYARRTGIERREAERWLAPNLGYEPTAEQPEQADAA
jgi:5-methyltetrahydrofolate--homocysteine methyltransferase